MIDPKPVWALDVDGVINACVRSGKPDRSVWPAEVWLRGNAVSSDGDTWPILAARPVCDFIRRAHDSGKVDIRWHTTWQDASANIAALLDLPDFPVLPCPEFAEHRQGLWGDAPAGGPWWKLAAARRIVDVEDRDLLWTDDDASTELRLYRDISSAPWPEVTRRVLVIAPQVRLGLTRKHLRAMAEFLRIEDPILAAGGATA